MKILAVDIGNTNTHFGLFDSLKPLKKFTMRNLKIRLIYKQLRAIVPDIICYSSVVPKESKGLESYLKKYFGLKPLNITRDFPAFVKNMTRNPETTGQDRLANGSWAYYARRSACCIVDVGSAVNFDVVDENGLFLGGIIGPGLGLISRAMNNNLALIPVVEAKERKEYIGRDTSSSLQIGSMLAVKGLINLGIKRVDMMFHNKIHIIGTGQDARFFKNRFDEIIPDITLKGIVVSFLVSENKLKLSRKVTSRYSK